MITKEYGKNFAYGTYSLTCDYCLETTEEGFESFYDAVEHAEKSGWGREYVRGEWHNACPECKGAGEK